MKIKILIGGDTCPIGQNQNLFEIGDAHALLNDLQPELEQADLTIVNLECPLIREESPIEKVGPNLGAPVDCVNGLKAMGIDLVGLANNHIMDHGIKGLESTIDSLRSHGIAYVGAGKNLEEARRIQVHNVKGLRIGVFAVAEHEFGIATKNIPGANPLDVIDFVRNINEHSSEFDMFIVLVHGGNEYYQYPRPGLMDICRFYVEQGASAVICQHSHCVGCMETYQGAPIVYGQGNFLFDWNSPQDSFYDGLLIVLEISPDRESTINLLPYRQSFKEQGIRRMSSDYEASFRDAFTFRSKTILDNSALQAQWEVFCQGKKRYYLNTLYGKPGFLRRLMSKLNLQRYLISQSVRRSQLNMIRCESHHEALITTLRMETDK